MGSGTFGDCFVEIGRLLRFDVGEFDCSKTGNMWRPLEKEMSTMVVLAKKHMYKHGYCDNDRLTP
jgi:hypothetical protein